MAREDDYLDQDNPYAAPETYEFEEDMSEENSGVVEYATFWARFAAVFIDGILIQIVSFVLGMATGFFMLIINAEDESLELAVSIVQLMTLVLQWILVAGFNSSSYMATPGKMAIGIKVTDLRGNRIGFGQATGRYFGKAISSIILGIGYLMQPFTEKKQALHDIMAGTLVVKK